MNNSDADSITTTDAKQSRIAMAERFFNFLFANVMKQKFGYLWAKRGDEKITYPFDVSSAENRHAMAVKAIELNDAGYDAYYGINLTDTPPAADTRVTTEHVTLQTAIVTDIDVEGGTHISNEKKKYPPTFDVAKSLLPFPPSILIDSGYGLHGLNLFSVPLIITADNRQQAISRNKKYLEVIRSRAGDYIKAVDSVGDLPRVLRVPGTRNYKLGIENAPLCRIVEVNDLRFSPEDFDARLKSLAVVKEETPPTPAPILSNQSASLIRDSTSTNNHEYDQWRAIKMLEVISVADLSRDEWINVGMALKNNGNACADWERWSRDDDRFKDGECDKLWKGFDGHGLTIATIADIAKRYSYDPKAVWKEWCELHPEFKNQIIHRPAQAHDTPDDTAPMDDQLTFASRLDYLKSLPQSPERDEQIIAQIRELCDWKVNRKGERLYILPTFNSLRLIWDNDPNLQKLVGYDEFQGADVLLKRTPWKRADFTHTEWTDKDEAQLRLYLREHYAELQGKQIIEDMTTRISQANSFNVVKNYFASLPKWDGTPRAETLFIHFLRVDDTPYAREVTLNWLIGAVARIFHPGCRYQTALVLHGNQKIGKSYIIECIGGKWYIELTDNVDDSHASDAIKKGWLVEIKEMAAMRKAEINAVKAFIERSSETRRAAYDRHATTTFRHCVFAITVNDSEFLRDVTGNRRYMILHCNSKMFDYVEGLTDEFVSQLWAEVYFKFQEMFKDGFDEKKLSLSRDTEIRAEEIATHYMQDDGMTSEIKGFLNKKIPPQFVWQELTKEERRQYFIDGFIKLPDGEADLIKRRRARGGKDVDADTDKISSWLSGQAGAKFVRKQLIKRGEIFVEDFYIYGSEYRQHICAAELFNECFGSDKRKAMYRLNDILETLEGWTKGKRLQNADTTYSDQKKPFYRNAENQPTEEPNTPAQGDDFDGEPVVVPF